MYMYTSVPAGLLYLLIGYLFVLGSFTGCISKETNGTFCCTISNPCGLHEGHCHHHTDSCIGNLLCGQNNCFDSLNNCCFDPTQRSTNERLDEVNLPKTHIYISIYSRKGRRPSGVGGIKVVE